MIELTVFFTLIGLYLVLKRDDPFEPQVVYAVVFMATYLVVYLYLPPKLTITSMRLGPAFGYVPAMSFGAILFPELNSRFPVAVTRCLGWVGLLVVFSALCVLKLFVW